MVRAIEPEHFKYIEAARRFALQTPGSEMIVQAGNFYEVHPLETTAFQTSDHFVKSKAQAQLQAFVKTAPQTPLEFIIDSGNDGANGSDIHYTLNAEKEVKESKYPLTIHSDILQTPEEKALAIFRRAFNSQNTRYLIELSPTLVDILRSSEELPPEEREYFTTHLDSKEAISARQLFIKFLGPDTSFQSAGTIHYSEFVEALNDPFHIKNLALLHELAQHPESFQGSWSEDETRMVDVAQTLKKLPGFRRYPSNLSGTPEKHRMFEDALRTLDHYRFKLRINHGMNFNKAGLTSYGSEVQYRFGGSVVSLGLSGKDYNFTDIGNTQGMAYQDHASDVRQRLALGYSSGGFDVKVNVARGQDNKIYFERPESDAADRYIARKQGDVVESVKKWAKENMFLAGTIVAGAVAGVYVYSKYKPDQEIPAEISASTTLYQREHFRIKAAIKPKITLKDGKVDLGVKDIGIGASGNADRQFYDINIRQKLENTSIRSKKIESTSTEVNLRYGVGTHSVTLDGNYEYKNKVFTSRVGYRKDFIISPGFRAYTRPYVGFQGENMEFQTAGASVGAHKEFGKDRSYAVDVSVNYDYASGFSGGFMIAKEFRSFSKN